MPSFEEMGLRAELLRAIEDEELHRPTGLQEAVIPALRRGGNLVARASSGAGKTLAYGLGVLDRLKPAEPEEEPEAPLRVLVLTPTAQDAEHVALALIPYAQVLGLQVAVAGAAWGTALDEAGIVVAAAGEVMGSVRASAVKLDSLEAVVVDGASTIADLGDWDQADALLDLIPRDAQRVVVSATLPAAVEDLIERRVKRALRYPHEPAIAPGEAPPMEGTVGYVVVPEREKPELLAGQLRQRETGSAPPVIFCRNDERAADLAERLTVRGFLVGEVGDADADVAIAAAWTSRGELLEDAGDSLGQTISFDVPADAASLRERHGGDEDAIVLVEPRELAHLHEIARQARFRARSTPLARDLSSPAAALHAFREEIRTALRQEDLSAQMLVLEPLFEEFTAVEIAAAAAALLRTRRSAAAVVARSTPPAAALARAEKRTPAAGPAPVTWARLFVGLGSRDDIKPGDLVGALAGEADIPGSRIGKIEIRDNFSIVEVESDVADQVIRAVNGTTMKGRSVRVDYDRGGPARRPPVRGAPARRATRRPPGGPT
jgi:ATP-dependent RNA helicase DeaD